MAKTKALISCSVTAQLICAFVFAYVKIRFFMTRLSYVIKLYIYIYNYIKIIIDIDMNIDMKTFIIKSASSHQFLPKRPHVTFSIYRCAVFIGPPHEKTNNRRMQKQRRRSASR